MAFLISFDYLQYASQDDIDVLTEGDENLLSVSEENVLQEISSYLSARYDLSGVFINVKKYSLEDTYTVGDLIFLSGSTFVLAEETKQFALVTDGVNVYVCLQDSTNNPLTDEDYFEEIGLNNKFYVCIAVTLAGDYPNDEALFEQKDSRVPILKRMVANLVLYELHSKANPRVIPEYRKERRDEAISWLKAVANPKMNVNADFLTLNDYGNVNKSNNFSWGSVEKRDNVY